MITIILRLHDQAGSTSWLYVSWTSQLDVCSLFPRSCKQGIKSRRLLVAGSRLQRWRIIVSWRWYSGYGTSTTTDMSDIITDFVVDCRHLNARLSVCLRYKRKFRWRFA